MPKKRTARRKQSVRKAVSRVTSEKFGLNQLMSKRHRPLHIAGIGGIMMFLQGIIALVGVLLIIGAAITYAMRAFKANR